MKQFSGSTPGYFNSYIPPFKIKTKYLNTANVFEQNIELFCPGEKLHPCCANDGARVHGGNPEVWITPHVRWSDKRRWQLLGPGSRTAAIKARNQPTDECQNKGSHECQNAKYVPHTQIQDSRVRNHITASNRKRSKRVIPNNRSRDGGPSILGRPLESFGKR